MSDLHNLSAPIEESPEDISQKVIKEKSTLKLKYKEDIKILLENFKRKYLRKLLLSIGIASTLAIALLWGISLLMTPKNEEIAKQETTETQETAEINQEGTVKYRKFDGHQYYFYVPENYSFLNRTRNDDLNEIVFSYENGDTAFILQEFEADNDNEETLDSIYSYIFTTLEPNENTEIKIEDNTFKKRVYKKCEDQIEDSTSSAKNPVAKLPEEKVCSVGKAYYSIYINGIVVIFETLNTDNNDVEKSILPTLTKNIIDSRILSEEYMYARAPAVENRLQALFTLGQPTKIEEKVTTTEMSWQTTGELLLILDFVPHVDSVRNIYGIYGDNFKFNMRTGIKESEAKSARSNLLASRNIRRYVLTANPNAVFFLDDTDNTNNSWEVTVKTPDKDGAQLIGEYLVDKTTLVVSAKPTN